MDIQKTHFFLRATVTSLALLVVAFQQPAYAVDLNTPSQQEQAMNINIFDVIKSNDLKSVQQYIESKGALEKRNIKGQTPLMAAVYQQHNDIAKALILAGADVNAQDIIRDSPFLYAGAEGNLEVVKLALAHGANFKVYNRYGGSALIPAAEKGHVEVVKLLVNTPNYPIDHVNNLGWTALMEAIVLSNGGPVHIEIVKALIDGGVNVNIPDKKGITPLQQAKKRNFTEIMRLLEAAGAK